MNEAEQRILAFFKVFYTVLSCTHIGQLEPAESFVDIFKQRFGVKEEDGYMKSLRWVVHQKRNFYNYDKESNISGVFQSPDA